MWYVSRDGKKSGPFSKTQMNEMISSHLVECADHVWANGMGDWVTAEVAFGLAPGNGSSGPPPPPKQSNGSQLPPQSYVSPPPYQSSNPYPNNNPYGSEQEHQAPMGSHVRSGVEKVPAALLAIFLGGLGIHKFYMGYKNEGIIMLAVTVLTFFVGGFFMGIIGLIEGIIYISMHDEQFRREYVAGHKPWF